MPIDFVYCRQRRGRRFRPVSGEFVQIIIAFIAISAYGQMNARIAPAAKEALASVHPSAKVKLVFTCQDTMRYVDFSEVAPQIYTIADAAPAYFPVISSDGNWVTYQTGVKAEGPSGDATPGTIWCLQLAVDGTPIKIADTGYVPRFVQNTQSDSPEIIYSTSLTCPNNICYTSGRTLKKKIVTGAPQAEQIVYGSGSYYGGLSWDGRFLITGWPTGPNAFMLDLQDTLNGPHAVHTMRVKKNVTDADTIVALQACNISRSASTIFTNTMLYFDYGSFAMEDAACHHPLLGNWGIHAKLFISRYDGEDMKVFDMPADRPLVPSSDAQGLGEAIGKKWYNPEWSNHPYYAAASLHIDRIYDISGSWEHTENREYVYLVNLKDSSYIRLIESTDTSFASKTDLTFPFLWIEVPAGFQEDSTWLKSTIWERAAQGVIHDFHNKKLLTFGDNFLNDKNVTGLVLYSLSGQRIKTVRIDRNAGIDARHAVRNIHAGVYLIGIKTQSAKQRYVRWVVGK